MNLSGGGYTQATLLLVGTFFCSLSCGLPQKYRIVQYVSLALLAVYAVTASRWIADGWNITVNQVFAGLEIQLGRIFPRYEVRADQNMHQVCAALFLALPAAILGLAAGWSANGKPVMLLVFDALVLAAALIGLYTPDSWTVLLILATAAACSSRVTYRNNSANGGSMAVWLLAIMALLTAASLLPALLAGDGSAAAEKRRLDAARQIYRLRYEQTEQLLPRGDFTELKNFAPDADKNVMTVTMSEPASIYLRGFVGERYIGDGWIGLPAATKAESAMAFTWLHNRGFYGQNQLAQLADALNMEKRLIQVSVDNKTAGSGYIYTPYELKTGSPDANQIGDADLPAVGLHGQRQYEYYVTDRSVSGDEALYSTLSEKWRAGDEYAMKYLESENVYREYVYANYLDVPEEAAETIRKLLGGQEVPEGGLSFDTARSTVQAFLSSALAYSETPQPYEGGDFLTFLLEDSHEGYSVHYATAAALLFRTFGIPARYVEGYYISAEDAAAAWEKGEPVEVGEADAHAWVEIYRDGVGFVPFEVKPSDVSSQEHSEQNKDNAGGAEEEEPPLAEPISILEILLWALIGMLVLGFLTLAFRRIWLRRRWNRRLRNCSPGHAVELWTAYIVRLLGYFGVSHCNGSLYRLKDAIIGALGREMAESFEEVVTIQQQARFSLLPVKDNQRVTVCDFADSVTRRLKDHCRWPVRFRLRYLDCII
ncbi:transglutaminase-like domain-containing protein [Sporobacter termitidis]|uniref:transglutaminase-like domain-containing protein n=1 Tax=Sporobacter termitidis TaxID=44749 RepID=UPI0009330BD7|nr:transglutaminase-like domain-containing protein [Sporobacter termitidis]